MATDRFPLALLATVACAVTAGRIAAVQSPFGPNDYSRWATIAALVETGDYEIGRRVFEPDGGYRDLKAPVLVDVLLHPETHQFYSSKPPLLPTLLAGEMVVMKLAGWEPAAHGARMLRVMLLTSNLVPIALFLIALMLMLERMETSPRASLVVMIAAGFGTTLTTFATTITNHVGAAAAAGIALFALARILLQGERSPKWFLLAGLCAGWTASQEVPALGFVPALALPLFLRARARTLMFFLPAALAPLAAFWLTNHLALGDPFWFYHPDPIWSKFPGSYWTQKVGIDRGESSSLAYVFHFTIGHHGVLSLAPIFVASLVGMTRPFRRGWLAALLLVAVTVLMRHLYRELHLPLPIAMAPLALASIAAMWKSDDVLPRLAASMTVLTFGFYLVHTSNYGGVAAGPRWLMWLVPLWLVAAVPVFEEALASRRKTLLVIAALAVSIFSASHPLANPWVHPWLYELLFA